MKIVTIRLMMSLFSIGILVYGYGCSPETHNQQRQVTDHNISHPSNIGYDEDRTEKVSLSDNKIKAVQTRLKAEGYDIKYIDGILGPNTKKAIEEFQEDNDLVVTGFLNKNTLELMYIPYEEGRATEEEVYSE